MQQFGSIFRLRRRLTRNRIVDLGARRRASSLALMVAGAAALVVAGHLAAPTLMEPPIDLATPRGLDPGELPAGTAALEASFWLTALIASVLNFRILELLFRRPDVVALQPLPVEPAALFVDRLAATWTEAIVAASGASLFFIPLIWHGGGAAAAASIAMLFGGLIFGATISMVVMILATGRLVPDEDGDSGSGPVLSDAYGGPGQILLYAPAVGLGGVVTLALFWKLLLGEPFRLGYASKPFWIGTAIVAGTVVACLTVAYRTFVSDYYAMAPRFHEADAADFSAVADYQQSSFQTERLWEAGLPRAAAHTCRALLLDDDRRMAGARVGYAVVLVLAAVGLTMLELNALPLWAAAMVPAILIAVVVNPWVRLARRSDHLGSGLALPVSDRDRARAADRVALREFLFVGAPYAVAAALILGYFRDLGGAGYLTAAAALAAGFGIGGGISLARRLGSSTSAFRWLPTALLVALTAVAITSLPALVATGAGLYVVAALVSLFSGRRHAD